METALAVTVCAAGLGWLGARLARPRGGPPLLMDAVVEHLRSPLALLCLPLPALLVGVEQCWPELLGVLAFALVFVPA